MVRPRKLTINLLWLYGGELLAKLLGVATFGYLARSLERERYGELESAIAVVFVLNLVQEAGLMPYGAREAAKHPEQTRSLAAKIVIVRGLVAALTIGLLVALAALIASPLVGKPDAVVQLLLFCGLLLVPGPLMLNWVFQSRDEMSVVAGTSLLRNLVLAGGVFLFVRSAADAWMMPCCDVVGLVAAIAVQHVLFRRRVGKLSLRGGLSGSSRVLREAMPIAMSSLAWALRVFLPVIVLGVVDAAANGDFASGHRLVTSMHAFVWLYFFNLLPSLSRALDGSDRTSYRELTGSSLRLVSWGVLTVCLALWAAGPALVVGVFGTEVQGGVGPFRLSLWMLALAFLSGHQRYALIAGGHQGDELRASAVGAVVSAIGCACLCIWPSAWLAAGVLVAAELATLIVADRLVARRIEPIHLFRRALRPVTVLAPMAVVLVYLLPDSPLVGALLVLVCGGAGALVLDGRRLRSSVAAWSLRTDRGAADS